MDNYVKGQWKAYCLGSEGYQVRKDNEGVPAAKIKEELKERLTPIVERMGGSFETQRVNAELIASAVNACISVNPDNPQVVAESIKDMYEALKLYLSSEISTPEFQVMGRKAIAKSEGR